MATLISAHNSEGCYGRCDAKCYGAASPDCDCICGGMNHGKGEQQAYDNTRDLAESWVDKYKALHPPSAVRLEFHAHANSFPWCAGMSNVRPASCCV